MANMASDPRHEDADVRPDPEDETGASAKVSVTEELRAAVDADYDHVRALIEAARSGLHDLEREALEFAHANDERFGVWGGWAERYRRSLRRMALKDAEDEDLEAKRAAVLAHLDD